MDVAGNNSSSSDDDDWLMSPVGPVAAFVIEQSRILEMTTTLAMGSAMTYSNKRRRLLDKKRGALVQVEVPTSSEASTSSMSGL